MSHFSYLIYYHEFVISVPFDFCKAMTVTALVLSI
jgi:hypothetical protein